MSAGNLSQLFTIEKTFEAAFKLILQEAGIETVYITREKVISSTPSVGVKVIVGDVNDKHTKRLVSNKPTIYDSWDSQLEVQVKTNRLTDGQEHSTICGKVRAALTLYSLSSSSIGDTASYFAITDIRERQGATEFDDAANVDTTLLNYYVLLNIRDDAWPA